MKVRFLVPLLALLLTGCLQLEQTFQFNSDSTLTVTYFYRFDREQEKVLRDMLAQKHRAGTLPPAALTFLDKEATRAAYAKHDIDLRLYSREEKGTQVEITVIALSRTPEKHLNDRLFGNFRFTRQDRKRRLEAVWPEGGRPVSPDPRMASLCEDFAVKCTVLTNGKISSSSGTVVDSRQVNWRLSLEQLLQQPKIFVEWQ